MPMKVMKLRWFTALLLLVLPLYACSKKMTEEERVRETVREAAEAVSAKDLKGFMRLVSKDYNDEGGNDYDSVKGIIFFQLMKPGAVRVFLRGVDVEVDGEGGDTALVNARAFIVRASAPEGIPDIIPENAEGFRFSVVMRREDGKWRALSAKWDEVGVLGLL
jgi:ketosteroid isomerase-like protein